MKFNIYKKYYSSDFVLTYLIVIICSCSVAQSLKYKSMSLSVNSKSYLNTIEKTNEMLEKYKSEISKK